ncbi:PIN domain-containing protein [Brevundimonas staleyi]|uniref:Ribonuclease VapC n=1 Tax=Brevundimonas staleyi TaxID=74326 RepID=A0ABW0FTC9_9CAUL
MILSLDTSIWIDLHRRRNADVLARFSEATLSSIPMVVSVMVLHELETGLAAAGSSERRRMQLDALLAQCSPIDFSADDSRTSGELRARLRDVGTPIGEIDTLIAGQALARGWTVVTRNVRHFGRVPGLSLIDWSVGPNPLAAHEIAARISG